MDEALPSCVREMAEARVRDAVAHARKLGEEAVQVAAYLGDHLLAEIAVGDIAPGGPVATTGTLFPVFSLTKAVTATAVHVQAARGLIDYAAPVATYWPEFARCGKDTITVGHVLTHRSGLPQVPDDIDVESMCDWDWMVTRLAGLEPIYPAGERSCYSPLGFGWILGEVVRRTDPAGRSFRDFVLEEVCGPLGMEDFHIGLPPEAPDRVARLSFPGQPPAPPAGSPVHRASPPRVDLVPEVFNRKDVHRAVLPSVGGVSTAEAMARLFAMLAQGGVFRGRRLLDARAVETFLRPASRSDEADATYGRPMPVGMGGYWLAAPNVSTSGPLTGRILAHTAAGGTIGWADLDTGLAVVVCHNRMFFQPADPPFALLGDALRDVVSAVRSTAKT